MKKILLFLFIFLSLSGFSQWNIKVDTVDLYRGGELYYQRSATDTVFLNADTILLGDAGLWQHVTEHDGTYLESLTADDSLLIDGIIKYKGIKQNANRGLKFVMWRPADSVMYLSVYDLDSLGTIITDSLMITDIISTTLVDSLMVLVIEYGDSLVQFISTEDLQDSIFADYTTMLTDRTDEWVRNDSIKIDTTVTRVYGAGINVVTGSHPNITVTATEVDGSITNEGDISVTAGGANTSVLHSNTSGSTDVTLSGSTYLNVTEAGNTVTFTPTGLQPTITPANVTAGSNKITLGGTPTAASLESFSIDVDETKINHDNLLNYVGGQHYLQPDIDTVNDDITGMLKATSGVLAQAVAGVDYPAALWDTTGGTPTLRTLHHVDNGNIMAAQFGVALYIDRDTEYSPLAAPPNALYVGGYSEFDSAVVMKNMDTLVTVPTFALTLSATGDTVLKYPWPEGEVVEDSVQWRLDATTGRIFPKSDKSIELVNTTSASTGVIYKEGESFIHNFANTTPIGHNVFIGEGAGNFTMDGTTNQASNNTIVGTDAFNGNTTGASNMGIGWQVLKLNTTGSWNSAIGTQSMIVNTTGYGNTANGVSALRSNTIGFYNLGLGYASLYSNTTGWGNIGIGAATGWNNTTGTGNIFIGDSAGYNASQKVDAVNSMALGSYTYTTASNQFVYGNSSVTRHEFNGGSVFAPDLAVATGDTSVGFNPLTGEFYAKEDVALVTPANVTVGSTKITLAGTPTGAALQAFSIDVDETKINHDNLLNWVAGKHFLRSEIDSVDKDIPYTSTLEKMVMIDTVTGIIYRRSRIPVAVGDSIGEMLYWDGDSWEPAYGKHLIWDPTPGSMGINSYTPNARLEVIGEDEETAIIGISSGDNSIGGYFEITGVPGDGTGYAVYAHGEEDGGGAYGVWAQSDSSAGIALYATSQDGTALSVAGRANFSDYIEFDQAAAPSPTTDRLYNVSGDLFWNGTEVGAATSGNIADGDTTNEMAVWNETAGEYQATNYNGLNFDPATKSLYENSKKVINHQEINNTVADGKGMWFDGTNDVITASDDADIDFGTGDFSIALRFKTGNVSGTEYLLNKEAGGIGYGIYKTDDDIYIRFDDNTADASAIILTAQIVADTWYSLIITFDRSGNATAYLDGASGGTVDISGTSLTLDNAGDLTIGSTTAGASFFDGDIQGVEVFSNSLTATVVKALSEGGATPYKYTGASNAIVATYDTSATQDLAITLTAGKQYRWDVGTADSLMIGLVKATGDTTFLYSSGTVRANGGGAGDLTGSNLLHVGEVLSLDPAGMSTATWYDQSGNSINGTVSGAVVNAAPVSSNFKDIINVYGTGLTGLTITGGESTLFPLITLDDDETGGSQWNIENGRAGDGILGFYNMGTKVAIDATGNVGIGTVAPTALTHIDGNKTTSDLLIVSNDNDGAYGDSAFKIDKLGNLHSLRTFNTEVTASEIAVFIDNTGKMGYSTSKKAAKEKIKPMENINWLYKLRPVNFIYKSDSSKWKRYGFIAEEVDSVNSNLVLHETQPGTVSGTIDTVAKTVFYERFIAVLVKALQNHKEELDALNPLISISTITTGGTATDTYTVNDTTGIEKKALASTIYFNSPSAVDFTAGVKQIANGKYDGQIISITGFDNTNTITLDQNNNIKLDEGVTWVGGKGDEIVLKWVEGLGNWYERSRSNN